MSEGGSPRLKHLTRAGTEPLREALRRDGYVLVRGVLERQTVDLLREAVEDVVRKSDSPDLLRAHDGHVRKVTYPLGKHPAFLETLAHPSILGLALSLSPDPADIVLTWEDVLVKPAFIGLGIPVHQDLSLQCVRGHVFSLGIHLDDADENPIWFRPGSHRQGPLTRHQVRALREAGGFVAASPRAGDVLVHDVLTAHYSDPNFAPTSRHTWYLEFRTRAQLRTEGPWDDEWIASRRALLFHAAALREAAGLDAAWPALALGETRASWLERTLECRVPHVTGSVNYDLASPYYHFD